MSNISGDPNKTSHHAITGVGIGCHYNSSHHRTGNFGFLRDIPQLASEVITFSSYSTGGAAGRYKFAHRRQQKLSPPSQLGLQAAVA